MKTRNPRLQHLIPAGQQFDRDLSNCDELPPATQQWMCPNCSVIHIKVPINLELYRCSCGWSGNRKQLLCAELTSLDLPNIIVTSRKGPEPFVGEYIGRPSPLGNPFAIGRDGTRTEVILKYEAWLSLQILNYPGSIAAIELLRLIAIARKEPLRLVCWCAPKPCHGDVIASFIHKALTGKSLPIKL